MRFHAIVLCTLAAAFLARWDELLTLISFKWVIFGFWLKAWIDSIINRFMTRRRLARINRLSRRRRDLVRSVTWSCCFNSFSSPHGGALGSLVRCEVIARGRRVRRQKKQLVLPWTAVGVSRGRINTENKQTNEKPWKSRVQLFEKLRVTL